MPTFFTDLKIEDSSPFKKIYEWEAPERQWTLKTRGWYVVYSLFFVCIVFIAALLQEYIFIIAIIAFAFLWFVQGSIPPQITTYTITSIGIRAFDKLYKWRNISHFWFSEKNGVVFLNLETTDDENPDFVKRIPLIVNTLEEQKIFDLLINYIDYGDKSEITYNIFSLLLSGRYYDISEFMELNENSEDDSIFEKLKNEKEILSELSED